MSPLARYTIALYADSDLSNQLSLHYAKSQRSL
jgi:hypothetical protein